MKYKELCLKQSFLCTTFQASTHYQMEEEEQNVDETKANYSDSDFIADMLIQFTEISFPQTWVGCLLIC